ncbi:MAG: response regulator [Thermodesulfobacteriota bacterium]
MTTESILIVDDDRGLLENLTEILEEEGYEVIPAGTCAQARRLARQRLPLAAIVDDRLPDGTGTDLLGELAAINPDCSCIMMTAYAHLDSVLAAYERGALHYIRKPFQPEELIRLTERIFETVRLRDQKRQTEEALKESERRFREILENVRLVSVCLDPQGNVTFCNDYLLELTGYRRAEVIGRNWFDLFVPVHKAADIRRIYMERIARNAVPPHGENSILTKDGDTRLLNWNNTLLRHPSGNVVGMASIGEDITERRSTEQALRESEDRLRLILERIHAGILLVDCHTHKVVDANPVALELVGADKGEVIGADYRSFFCDHAECRERSGSASSRVDHMEEHLIRMDGSTVPVLRTAVPVVLNSRGYLLESFVDLTDRKRLEEEQARAEKLESIGVLAGGIAHDFNNLLTGMLGNISAAKMHMTPGDRIYRRLADAEKAATRAKRLTQQLVTLASGGAPVKRIGSLIELIRDATDFALPGSNVRCELHLPEDLWWAEFDEGQTAQVLHNLIINADQAMPQGGRIEVRAENLHLPAQTAMPLVPGDYVRVSVIDYGVGISEEHLPKIFDPYFTTKQAGSGLGLATSYSIVKNHGGHMTVESKLGQGTTFHIYLPAIPEGHALRVEERPARAAGTGRILVMDDEEIIRDLAADLLGALGYEVEVASEGRLAVELFRQARDSGRPFDLVIMDLTIPGGLGGKDAIGEMREIDPSVKGIVSSGYSDDPVMADFRKYGFSEVIAKPYGMQELSDVVRRVMEL